MNTNYIGGCHEPRKETMSSKTAVTALRGRGRPKHFDADAALDVALRLFWQHGFEATSMHDLVATTGAKAPTLYHAFGNKRGSFARRWNVISSALFGK